jgi:hypothetical protein
VVSCQQFHDLNTLYDATVNSSGQLVARVENFVTASNGRYVLLALRSSTTV